MKRALIYLLFFSYIPIAFAQNSFETAIEDASIDIASKLIIKDKTKLVVLYITDANKKQTITGKYIADIISVNIVNHPGNFYVFDRENLSSIAEANKLIDEGFIDGSSAQELGRLLEVEAIVIGNYIVLSETIKLTLKALDVKNGFVIAATMIDLPIDANAASLLGINIASTNKASNNLNNRGFNAPLKSGENYNDPNTVNKDCVTNNTGDYCFTNEKDILIQLDYHYSERSERNLYGKISIAPGQTVCLYNLKSGVWKYRYYDKPKINYLGNYKYEEPVVIEGQFLVEQCKSKTYIFK